MGSADNPKKGVAATGISTSSRSPFDGTWESILLIPEQFQGPTIFQREFQHPKKGGGGHPNFHKLWKPFQWDLGVDFDDPWVVPDSDDFSKGISEKAFRPSI